LNFHASGSSVFGVRAVWWRSVSLDGKIKDKTAPHIDFSRDVEPGEHELTCFAENNSKIKLNAQPDQSHFLWQEI
jgi:hypothetical protein